jgi:hypothetical protein
MEVVWIKPIDKLPKTMIEDLKKEKRYRNNYYGVLGTVIYDNLKVGDTFHTAKIQIGVPYEFEVVCIYGSKENAHTDPNSISLSAKRAATIIVIAEGVKVTEQKHKEEVLTAKIQRDSSYYGPLSFRDAAGDV